MVAGLQQLYPDDEILLQQGMIMVEALARSFTQFERTAHPERLAKA
jgi:hypothetical protein